MRGDEDTVETDASGKVLVGVGAALAATFITTLSSRFNCGVFWHWFCTLLMYSRSSSLLVFSFAEKSFSIENFVSATSILQNVS